MPARPASSRVGTPAKERRSGVTPVRLARVRRPQPSPIAASAPGGRRRPRVVRARVVVRGRAPCAAASEGERLGRQGIEGPSGGEVEGAGDVDGVVALVHAGRLEVVRGAAKARVQQQPAEALRADLAGPDVLVPVGPRAEAGPRVVQVDHHQPVEPDERIEAIDQRVDLVRLGDPVARAPGVRGVDAEADAPRLGTLQAAMASAMSASSSTVEPIESPPPAEFSRTSIGCLGGRRRARGPRPRPSAIAGRSGGRAGSSMRTGVDVDEPGRESGRACHVVGEHVDRALVEVGDRAGQVHEIGGVDRHGPDVELGQALAEGRLVLGWRARRCQAVGLSPKIWSAVAPISWARSTALTIPPPRGRWAPSRRPSGSIVAILADRPPAPTTRRSCRARRRFTVLARQRGSVLPWRPSLASSPSSRRRSGRS